MNSELLKQLGLNEKQAQAYLVLITSGSLTPPQLAVKIKTTRTNAYSLLDKLVEIGLATKHDIHKKQTFRPENPIALEKLVVKARNEALQREKLVHASMPTLLSYYYTYAEQPGVRYFEGKEGIEEIYKDQVRTGKEVQFIRSPKDSELYGYEVMRGLRSMFPKHKIARHTFSPDRHDIPRNWQETDPPRLLSRTWLREDDYTAPVEWGVYGNKVSIISFGTEILGMVIESPQIAESFRQILKILDETVRLRPDYHELPKNPAVQLNDSHKLTP